MANGNKLLDQKAIDTIIDSILKAVEIKLNKKSSEGRGKDGKDGRDGKNAPQINDDEALSTNPWSGLKTQEEIAKVEGKIYPCTAQALEAMTQEQQAEIYAQGYRAIKTENNGTVVLLGLSPDGSLEWLGCNKDTTNMLDNSDFKHPVNQRGSSSYTNNVYTIDRWKTYVAGDKTVSISSDGITLEKGVTDWGQPILNSMFEEGQPYTFYLESSTGIKCCATETFIDSDTRVQPYFYFSELGCALNWIFAWTTSISLFALQVKESDVTLRCVALYKGSYTPKTLPPWREPDPVVELQKCLRYFRRFKNISESYMFIATGMSNGVGSAAYFPIKLDPPMRGDATPTLTVNDYARLTLYNGALYGIGNIAIYSKNVINNDLDTISLRVTPSSNGTYIKQSPFILSLLNAGSLDISKDL